MADAFARLNLGLAILIGIRELLSPLRLTQSGLSDLNWSLLLRNRSVKSLDRSLDVMDLLQSLKFVVGILRVFKNAPFQRCNAKKENNYSSRRL